MATRPKPIWIEIKNHLTSLLKLKPKKSNFEKFGQHVHNRGHGYSNRFSLCRGVQLSPHDKTSLVCPAYIYATAHYLCRVFKTIRIAVSPVMDMPGDFTQGVDFIKNVGMVWLDLSSWFGWNGWEVVSKKT